MDSAFKKTQITNLIEASDWGSFEDFAEYATDQYPNIATKLENDFDNNTHAFDEWLKVSIVNNITLSELMSSLEIQKQFDTVVEALQKIVSEAHELNSRIDNIAEEFWQQFMRSSNCKPTNSIEGALVKINDALEKSANRN